MRASALLPLLLPALGLAAQEPGAPPPNLVLFLVDDLGWNGAGFAGSRVFETPHMDRVAREGMVFPEAYSNGPNCAPSRACILSGQYPPRHGIYTVQTSVRGRREDRKLVPVETQTVLPDSVVTVAEALQTGGYATGYVGKWHLGPDPRSQGFDENLAGSKRGHPRSYFSPWGMRDLEDGPEGEYLTDRLGREAAAFVRRHRDEPFFLMFAPYAVHTPIQAPEERVARFRGRLPESGQDNATYAAMVQAVDDALGVLLLALEEEGLAERTVVVVTSDNGGHGPVADLRPLRGSKGMLYEGGIRVPFAVRWPGVVKEGSRAPSPVMGADLYPTFLEIAGLPLPEGQPVDGRSVVRMLREGRPLARDLFWHFPAYLEASQPEVQGTWRATPCSVIRSGHWKLLEFFEDGRLELYDLEADPGETRDRSSEEPERTRELHARLRAWREAVRAPVPTEPNPFWRP